MTWLAAIYQLLVDIPTIGAGIEKILGLFIKTPAQSQADTAVDQQKEADQLAKDGRPKWD